MTNRALLSVNITRCGLDKQHLNLPQEATVAQTTHAKMSLTDYK